ncbi:MAG TPA: hypothetical protein PLD23_19490, partial [Armatimonadota bacterium]|nr:hypothetical protein [Armatimonadota bacterium]
VGNYIEDLADLCGVRMTVSPSSERANRESLVPNRAYRASIARALPAAIRASSVRSSRSNPIAFPMMLRT